jgi:hypothetical protein
MLLSVVVVPVARPEGQEEVDAWGTTMQGVVFLPEESRARGRFIKDPAL